MHKSQRVTLSTEWRIVAVMLLGIIMSQYIYLMRIV